MTAAARGIFELSYNTLTKELGKGPLSDSDINKIGRQWFGKKWAGVGTADSKIAPKHDRYFIVNTGHDGSKGVHWVGVYRSPKGQIYTFDSFGRNLAAILPGFAHRVAMDGHGTAVNVNTDKIQSDGTDVCGQLSLSWLNAVRLAGLSSTLRLLAYSPDLLAEIRAVREDS